MSLMEKNKIFYKSFQVIFFKKMDSENQRVIYCEDGEFRVYCNICDELRIERY